MGFLEATKKLLKQGMVGALDNYGAPITSEQGPMVDPESGMVGYLPKGTDPNSVTHPQAGLPNLLTGGASGIYKLLQAGTDAIPKKYLPNRLYIPALEDAAKSYETSDKQIMDATGTPEPSNFAEVGMKILGNIAGAPDLPIPKGAKVPIKSIGDAAKGIGRGAVELVVPGKQGGVGSALIAAGIGATLSEAANTLAPSPDYHTISQVVHPDGVVRPQLRNKPIEEYLDPQSIQDYNHAVDTNDVATQDEILGQVVQLQEHDRAQSYLPPEPWYKSDEAKQAMALTGLAVAGTLGARTVAKTKADLLGSTVLAGQATIDYKSGVGTRAVQGAVQGDQAIRDATALATNDPKQWFGNKTDKERIIGKSGALQQWGAKLDGVTNPAIHSKQQHFGITGELPNSEITTKPYGPFLDAIQQGLSQPERDILTDGLLAGTALDDYKRTGKQTSFTQDKAGNAVSPNDVQSYFDRMQSNPKLKAIADGVKEHYAQQLDYLEEAGVISPVEKQGFKASRPNYVRLAKNEASDNSRGLWSTGDANSGVYDKLANLLEERSGEEAAGLSAGTAADPIAQLPDTWSGLIRDVEITKVKRDWFEFAQQSPELREWIKKLKPDEAANDLNQSHSIFNNGVRTQYVVNDPVLSDALRFQPFVQKNAVTGALNALRRNFEHFTTGAGNPFFAPIAASYDTFMGNALRPKGYNLGVLNEVLAHLNPKLGIGGLDPTWVATAPIGAARHAWDTFVGAMGSGLSRDIQAEGPLSQVLGPNVAQGLEAKLSSMYAASIKSKMDEAGIANANIFSSNAPDRASPGLGEVAPKFATSLAGRAFRDAMQGDHSLAQQILAGSHYAFEATRTNPIARIYSGLLKSMHEGFRYQAYATNLPRIIDKDSAELIASQTRRIAADIGQRGAGQIVQQGISSFAYANAGIQSLAQVGRMFKDQPLTFMTNTISTLLGIASLYYGPALISKEHRDEMRKRTEEQRMSGFTTFGDLPVRIPPELRPIWGSITAVLDDASGLNSVNDDGSDNFNPNFGKAIQSWLDNGLSDTGQQDLDQNIKEGLWGAMPATWGSSPVANSIAAGFGGLDIAFSRYTGRPQTVQPQKIDPLGGEGVYTDDAISANWQKAITDISGTMASSYVRAGLDVLRAKKDGADWDSAAKIGMSRILDVSASQGSPLDVMFGQYEKKNSANDGEMKLYQKKKQGWEVAKQILDQDVLTPFTDGKDPRSSIISPLDTVQNNVKLQGTVLVPIGMAASIYKKAAVPIEAELTKTQKAIDDINNQKFSTIEDRNKQINKLIADRKQWIKLDNGLMKQAEDTIRDQIGDKSFTWQDFGTHLEKYKEMPWQPPAQPSSVQNTPPTVQ